MNGGDEPTELGEFLGLDFKLPNGEPARVDGLEVIHDMKVTTSSGEKITLRSFVSIIDKKLCGQFSVLNEQGKLITDTGAVEDMNDEAIEEMLDHALYWLRVASTPKSKN